MFESTRDRLADWIAGPSRNPERARHMDWMPFLEQASPGFKRAAHVLNRYNPLDVVTVSLKLDRTVDGKRQLRNIERTSTAQDTLRSDYQKWIEGYEREGYKVSMIRRAIDHRHERAPIVPKHDYSHNISFSDHSRKHEREHTLPL
jgi:hypothetical protein